jgi:hypothetical protein
LVIKPEKKNKKKNSVNFRFKQIVVKVGWDFEGGCFFTGGGEAVTTFGQDLHQVVSQVTTSQIQTEDGVGQSVTYISTVI